jgi:signal transduction histidine kinase
MLNQLLSRMHSESVVRRYGLAVAIVGTIIFFRLLLQRVLGQEVPFLMLFVAVLLSAGFGGLGPGLLATLLGAMATIVLVLSPRHTFYLDRADLLPTLRFLVEGFLISVLGAGFDLARRRAQESEAQTRRLEQRILDISDDERRRIGQDLHDGLGQHLTGVAFLTKALQQRLISRSLPEAEDATKIASLVSESIGQTRALARGLAPVGLEGGGLAASLAQLATSTSTVFGVRCVLRADPTLEIEDLQIASHLYRIVQEAVTNAVRHAKANSIEIDMYSSGEALRLTIEDNGVGIPAVAENAGMGLQIMTFRAKMIGGSLAVLRREGGGTVVACTIPIKSDVRNIHDDQ